MAHPSPDRQRAGSSRPRQSGFSLIELLVVLAMAAVLFLIAYPALLNVASLYKVRSSAQRLEMLARQARYESIKLGQPVTVVGDSKNNMFYVISGTIAGAPPYNFPDGPPDIPPTQRVAVWEVPKGVSFAIVNAAIAPPCVLAPAVACPAFTFNSDGSGVGQTVTFSYPNQPSSTVTLAKPPATSSLMGKLTTH
jgi:prepilin-type N-terminal cleavage/methylation domain-containing protein